MSYQWFHIFLFGTYLLHLTEAVFLYNVTNTNKLLCYSCKDAPCETVVSEDDNVILCNKHTQLCWAGFVDQQPYRTCASRYCTPAGISLDSDIRIETCCHASLCNSVPLSWTIWSKWYRRTSTSRPQTSTLKTTTKQTTTTTVKQKIHTTPGIYIVNEMANNERYPWIDKETKEQQENIVLSKPTFNTSDPATFGITWERVPYHQSFSNRVASISKFLILLMPILLFSLL